MDGWLLAIAITVVALGALFVGLTARRGWGRSALKAETLRAGLEIPDRIADIVRARSRAAVRGSGIGLIVGGLGSVYLITLYAMIENVNTVPWLFFAPSYLGLVIGIAVGSVRHGARAQRGAIRVARLRATTVDDFVSARGRRFALVFALLALAVFVLLLANFSALQRSSFASLFGEGVVLSGTFVIAYVAYVVLSRVLIARGYRATSVEDMVWEDALLSSTLGKLLTSPLALGAGGIETGLLALSGIAPLGLRIAIDLVAIGVIVVAVIAMIALWSPTAQQRYLTRLWPDIAARLATARADRATHPAAGPVLVPAVVDAR